MKDILYKNGRIARDGKLEKVEVLVRDNIIKKIGKNVSCDAKIIDLDNKIMLPKLFDEHTHGSNGYDFNLANIEEMHKLIEFYRLQKVGTVFPTLLTDDIEVMKSQIRKIVDISKEYPEVKGIHLEGPFLSKEYKGAMPEYLLQKPSVKIARELVEASNGLVKLMTISPELEGAEKLTKALVEMGVTVNLGHSGATSEQAKRCLDAGATGFTHTFNAMRHMNQHELNIGGLAMLSDQYCEVIGDGLHIDKEVLNLIIKIKGLDKVIIITDSIMAAGLPDGMYKLGVNDVVVKNGDARLVHPDVRAGSTLTAIKGLKNIVKFTGMPVEKAIKLMTENPAKHNNMFEKTGSIDEGKLAEFFVYEYDNN